MHNLSKRCTDKVNVLQSCARAADAEKQYKPTLRYLRLSPVPLLISRHGEPSRLAWYQFVYDIEKKSWAIFEEYSLTYGRSVNWRVPTELVYWRIIDQIPQKELVRAASNRETSQY
jgi:hypothetical protein